MVENTHDLHEDNKNNSNKYIFGRKLDSIVIIGLPGSGKGTHASMLDKNRFFHISTGVEFRKIAEKDKAMHDLLSSGRYVSDDETLNIFYKIIQNYIDDKSYNPARQYLVLDGIPRTAYQNEILQHNFCFEAIIHLSIPEDLAVKRMIERNDSRPENNTESKALNRINVYKQNTEIILQSYCNNPRFIKISNVDSLSITHKKFVDSLEQLLD